jgi:hypothetical protein
MAALTNLIGGVILLSTSIVLGPGALAALQWHWAGVPRVALPAAAGFSAGHDD